MSIFGKFSIQNVVIRVSKSIISCVFKKTFIEVP